MNRRLLAACFALAGALLCGKSAYLHTKARLGQLLLDRAWSRTLNGEAAVKPWQWADTFPLARIVLPRQRKSFIVLAGASGRTLAWGPGHLDGTALPEERGNCVISAHRDTHFAVLRDVRPGDEIVVQTRDRRTIRYRVTETRVTNDRDAGLLASDGDRRLTLVTCHPFDAIAAGGHGRYVVIARGA